MAMFVFIVVIAALLVALFYCDHNTKNPSRSHTRALEALTAYRIELIHRLVRIHIQDEPELGYGKHVEKVGEVYCYKGRPLVTFGRVEIFRPFPWLNAEYRLPVTTPYAQFDMTVRV